MSSFKISMSTKFLLQLGRYSDHTCTDTTHKVMWEGFPLFLNGTTDMCRSYHPQSISICTQETEKEFEFAFNAIKDSLLNIFDYNYRPKILVADGAEAITNGFMKAFNYASIEEFIRIMCWSHVDRAYKAKLLKVKSKKIQEEIIADLTKIQESCCELVFKNSMKLFNTKWRSLDMPSVNEFLDYFNKGWVNSRLPEWYAGSALFCPAHNNACEGTNRWVKETHTKRAINSISRFLNVIFDMIRNWSLDRVRNKMFKFVNSVIVLDNTWIMAYNFLYGDSQGLIQQVESTDKFKLTTGNHGWFDVK